MLTDEHDVSGMKEKIKGFPDQIFNSWKKGELIKHEKIYNPSNIVVSGMGGSAIAGDLLHDLLFKILRIPLLVNRGYDLPSFVNKNTLLLISSYSGNTEETICALSQGLIRNAMIVVFTSDGKIAKTAEEKNLPIIEFPNGFPPRSALGFSFFSMLGFLKGILDLPLTDKDIEKVISTLLKLKDNLTSSENEITELAEKLINQIPLLYVSRRLKSVALRWQTQLNENSKTFAHINEIPEANHNEIVGLDYPKHNIRQMHLIFLRAKTYENEQIKKRFRVTEDILKNFVGTITTVQAEGGNELDEMFSLIYKGDFLSYFISRILKIDPTPVQRIDSLKKRLKS
ncbi:bifunctional phosphoglucose/phosphomannose isomerase [candidate division WOR-3 bacterium]|nr:bifunctional phosphoglucose/phosphomannose isomerase [candidate division WOR-3 bacterium]